MIGIPYFLQTRADWEHAYEYALKRPEVRGAFIARLTALKASKNMKMLKHGVSKPAEELAADDFEDVPDPASPFFQAGFSEQEIDTMITKLKGE
jgi:hypothetical protein